MGTLTVVNHVTLDGVMQAPARPDEDTRGEFPYGGWSRPYGDQVMADAMGPSMATSTALLLGRRTYEDFASVWPNAPQPNPFTEILNNTQKYVCSTTLTEPLPWMNSTLVTGDDVPRLKETENLVVLGSGVLVQWLLAQGLVDELLLTIHPLLLGTGHRLFADGGSYAALTLVGVTPTTTGVMIATYRTADV